MRFIIINKKGEVILTSINKFPFAFDSDFAEGLAMREDVCLADEMGLEPIIFEVDFLFIFKLLTSDLEDDSELHDVIYLDLNLEVTRFNGPYISQCHSVVEDSGMF